MKSKIRSIVFIICFLLIVVAGIWAIIYECTHIDQTEMRQFIENPYPTIMVVVGMFGIFIVREVE